MGQALTLWAQALEKYKARDSKNLTHSLQTQTEIPQTH